MLTINRGRFEEIVEAFTNGGYKSAMVVVTNSAKAKEYLHSLEGWEFNIRSLTASKYDKRLTFVFDKEHTYGKNFDYIGLVDGFPVMEDFLYYLTRLRKVK